jgi:hypothetical protein
MIALKIFFTVLLSLLIILFISSILVFEDTERSDFWFSIVKISGIATGVMLIFLAFFTIWNN